MLSSFLQFQLQLLNSGWWAFFVRAPTSTACQFSVATCQSTLPTRVFSFKDNYDPQSHGFVSVATYGDMGEADAGAKPPGATAPHHYHSSHTRGSVSRARKAEEVSFAVPAEHPVCRWESWAWAPQTAPSGTSPCSMGTPCAKPQFPLNAH